jgi:hypothetical protein
MMTWTEREQAEACAVSAHLVTDKSYVADFFSAREAATAAIRIAASRTSCQYPAINADSIFFKSRITASSALVSGRIPSSSLRTSSRTLIQRIPDRRTPQV